MPVIIRKVFLDLWNKAPEDSKPMTEEEAARYIEEARAKRTPGSATVEGIIAAPVEE